MTSLSCWGKPEEICNFSFALSRCLLILMLARTKSMFQNNNMGAVNTPQVKTSKHLSRCVHIHTVKACVFDDFISSLIFSLVLWHSAPSKGLWNFKRHLNNGWITHQDLTHSLTQSITKKKIWKQANTDLLQWSMTKLSFCN